MQTLSTNLTPKHILYSSLATLYITNFSPVNNAALQGVPMILHGGLVPLSPQFGPLRHLFRIIAPGRERESRCYCTKRAVNGRIWGNTKHRERKVKSDLYDSLLLFSFFCTALKVITLASRAIVHYRSYCGKTVLA